MVIAAVRRYIDYIRQIPYTAGAYDLHGNKSGGCRIVAEHAITVAAKCPYRAVGVKSD